MQIGEKYNCSGENFRGLLAFAAPKDATPLIFAEKTFANSHKTAKWYPYRHQSLLYPTVQVHVNRSFGSGDIIAQSYPYGIIPVLASEGLPRRF